MYLIEENIIDGNVSGYWVREKIRGVLVDSIFVELHPKRCSCRYFVESHNIHNHFHINLVENWIKHGKPRYAMYSKGRNGKILTLCPGYIPKN